jgi:protein TonB
MKTQETPTPQMDEIIFEKRNKFYGAYILRKMYNKQVNKALFFSIAILIAGLAYPLVSSYRDINHGRYIGIDDPTTYMPHITQPDEPKDLPILPPAKELQTRIRFIAPYVTNEEVSEEVGLPNQDEFTNTVNELVNVKEEQEVVKKDDVIDVEDTKPPSIIVEEMPSYPGGDAERQKFLAETIQYPQQALENGIQGTIYVQFIVDSKGNITDVKILRGIGGGCDEEALRVIKMMPQWHPGKQNGRAVRVLYHMPVSFKLH